MVRLYRLPQKRGGEENGHTAAGSEVAGSLHQGGNGSEDRILRCESTTAKLLAKRMHATLQSLTVRRLPCSPHVSPGCACRWVNGVTVLLPQTGSAHSQMQGRLGLLALWRVLR